jgi:hypothetical protein
MVPDLYVEITRQLHCLLDSLFVVGAFHNVGAPQKVTTATDGVDAISLIATNKGSVTPRLWQRSRRRAY